jgi:hypothetical protein
MSLFSPLGASFGIPASARQSVAASASTAKNISDEVDLAHLFTADPWN